MEERLGKSSCLTSTYVAYKCTPSFWQTIVRERGCIGQFHASSQSKGVTWFWHLRASDFYETFTRSCLALNFSRKLLLDPSYLRAKQRQFCLEFWPIFDIFLIDCGHIYVPKGIFWGTTHRIGDLVMNFFYFLGPLFMNGEWGLPKNGPCWTNTGQTWQVFDMRGTVSWRPSCSTFVGHISSGEPIQLQR